MTSYYRPCQTFNHEKFGSQQWTPRTPFYAPLAEMKVAFELLRQDRYALY